MKLVPGSFPWLLVNDLRLNWRRMADMFDGISRVKIAVIGLLGFLAVHGIAGVAAKWLAPLVHGEAGNVAGKLAPLATIVICMFSWMIAQSLFSAMRTLFDRGDLDLLLGSPLPPRRIFASKAMAIAASAFGSVALLTLPVANAGAIVNGPVWLAIYPVLVGLALLATALALFVAIGLFFLVGARRARLYTHVTAALIGGGFVLVAQIVAMLPVGLRESVQLSFEQVLSMADGGALSALQWPIRALRGDVGAMVAMLATGAVLVTVAVVLLSDCFARAVLAASGAPASGSPKPDMSRRAVRFTAHLGKTLRRKEWRLMLRDPGLFTQLGLQIVYTIPLVVVLMRSDQIPLLIAIAPAIVVISAQVAASLAWITVSGEDAPELMASAPVQPSDVDRAKLSAIALPVALVMGLPLIGLVMLSPKGAAVTFLFAAGASMSTALVNLWHPMPGNRRGMLRRHSQSKVAGLLEHGIAILWAVAIVFALIGSKAAYGPILIAVGMLAYVFPRRRTFNWRAVFQRRAASADAA